MRVDFTARHFKAPDGLRIFAEEEADKLNKFYDGLIKCVVILSEEKSKSKIKTAEIIVSSNIHHTFTAKEMAADYRISIERAFNKIKNQLRRYKEKLKSNHSSRNNRFRMK